MTVELAFRRDDLALRDVHADDDEALFHETGLVVQVRLRVGNRDILAIPAREQEGRTMMAGPEGASSWIEVARRDTGWAPQPIIGFLTAMRGAVRGASAGQRRSAYLALGWPYLHMERVQDDLLSVRLGDGAPEFAPTSEFESAVQDFSNAIQGWIREAAPQLIEHPAWKAWFAEAG